MALFILTHVANHITSPVANYSVLRPCGKPTVVHSGERKQNHRHQ